MKSNIADEKKKLIIFIDWFYPSYKAGGPIKSVFNIVSILKDSHEIRIITSAYDIDGTKVSLEHNQLVKQEGYEIIYLTKENQKSIRIKSLVYEFKPDLIYLNSVFSVNFSILPLYWFRLKFKIIIAPRGMLGAGALKIKAVKKSIFLRLGKSLLFSQSIIWHASSDLEENEIKGTIGKNARVQVAQNLSNPVCNRDKSSANKKRGELKLVFLSRISEKKNLLFILQLLTKHPELNITLDIYGPIEDSRYWEECSAYILKHERINYVGIVEPNCIFETLQQYHFSVLPTRHENYGHSIAESITSLVPVLISNNTPWTELRKFNVGYDLKLKNQDLWTETILVLYNLGNEEYCKMVEACFEYANQKIVNSEIVDQNKKLFT